MGFGKYLESKCKAEWSFYYINYSYLKKMVKQMKIGIASGSRTKKEAEHKFTTAIELEITKVNNFFLLGQKEMETKLSAAKVYLNKTVS